MDEAKRFKLTLKYRHADRYLAASRAMAPSAEAEARYKETATDIETKFEEDILRQSVSKFSHSTSIRLAARPDLNTLAEVMAFFPGLAVLNLRQDTPIVPVNDFEAYEIQRQTGKLDFGEKPKLKPCFSFWYLPDQTDGYPLVAEFSFDYDVLDEEVVRLTDHSDQLEQFPLPVVAAADTFFNALQSHPDWFDFTGTTKTAFGYNVGL